MIYKASETIPELNANVCLSTFKQPVKGTRQLADLYESNNSAPVVVLHKSCSPVNSKFVKTILIQF